MWRPVRLCLDHFAKDAVPSASMAVIVNWKLLFRLLLEQILVELVPLRLLAINRLAQRYLSHIEFLAEVRVLIVLLTTEAKFLLQCI